MLRQWQIAKQLENLVEGIGLRRTEHMFFDEERILSVRQMILSKSKEDRNKNINLPHQKRTLKKYLKLCQVYQSL